MAIRQYKLWPVNENFTQGDMMVRKQPVPIKPYFQVKHEYEASLKAYINVATMLHECARAACDLATEESAMRCIELLKKEVENFDRAAYERSQGGQP